MQIGAVRLGIEADFSTMDTLRVHIRPVDRHGSAVPVDPFFEKLTGITSGTLDDEGVPLAKSGWRPAVGATGSLSFTRRNTTEIAAGSFGVQIQQSIFDGFQTLNNVRAAEARVRASNENLRNTEQNILFNAAAA